MVTRKVAAASILKGEVNFVYQHSIIVVTQSKIDMHSSYIDYQKVTKVVSIEMQLLWKQQTEVRNIAYQDQTHTL